MGMYKGQLLLCETCNTLHNRWEYTIRNTASYSSFGSFTTRKKTDSIRVFCPLDPSHSCRIVNPIFDSTDSRVEFISMFHSITKEDKKMYKLTHIKNVSYIDLKSFTAQQLLDIRKLIK